MPLAAASFLAISLRLLAVNDSALVLQPLLFHLAQLYQNFQLRRLLFELSL
jgi:hypothetical protein